MPIYKVQAPDGRILRLEGPEGASEDQILQAASAAYQPQPEEGILRQAADIPVGVAKGAVQGVRNIADIFGAQNVVSQGLRGVEGMLGGLLSAQAKQDQQEIARIMKEAEDKGLGDQLAAAWQAFKTAPLDLAAQGIGSIAPFLVGGAGAKAAELGAAGTRALVGGMGAATGVGVVKSSIYDAVKEEFEKQGFSKETAAQYADKAQQYGENLDQIALGGILGGLSSMTGVESALIPKLAGDISKKLAANKVGRFALTTASEAGTEAAQAAQEQVAQNIALQREGVETPTFRGAAGAAALEGITGGVIGGGVGALTRGQPKAAVETTPEAPPEAQVAPVAPEAAVPAFEPTAVEPALRELEIAEAREAGQAVEPIPEMQPGEAIELDPAVKADIESVLQPGMTEEQARPVVQSIVDQTLKDLPVEIRQQAADSVVSDYIQKAQPTEQPTIAAPETRVKQPATAAEIAAPTTQVAPPAVKPVEPPRVRYGFDPVAFQETGTYSLVPVDQGGALFKTRQEAQQAKKFQADTKLQSVEGGYTLVQKRPDEIRADLIKAERMRQMPVAKGPLDILQFLASKGGLSPTLMSEISTEKNIRLGNKTLFAAKGKGLNESIAAEMAAEAGYINDNENLFDVINDSLKVKPRYSINDMDQVAEARYEDYLQAIEESGDAAGIIQQSGFTPENIQSANIQEGKPLNEVAALLTRANNLGIDVYGIEESVAARTEGLPQEQYETAVAAELERAINQAEQGDVSEFGKTIDVEEGGLSPFDVAPRITGAIETEADAQALNEDIRDNKIREYQGLKQRLSAVQKRFIEDKSRPIDNELYRSLYRRAEELKSEIDASKPKRSSPEDFMARAAKALADGDMDRETFDVIDAMFKKNPKFLDGLRLSVKAGPDGVTGQFLPISRIVRLFKSTGAISPGTARHEFTHTMEQMMPEDARQKIVDKWLADLKKAVETDKSDQARKYFTKVSEFLENPTQAKMNEAIAEMPSYEYYQYLTPSEYWAVNAEPLMNAYLGSSWQRFKMSMKGMLQAIKKVFGLNNNSEIYTAFKNAINGERRTTEMLVDYINSNLKIYDTKRRDYAGNPAPAPTWDTPPEVLSSKLFGAFSKTKLAYNLQDKYVDLKDIQKAIEKEGKRIEDAANAYQRENLYHKRVSDKVSSFLKKEGKPLLEEMQKRKVTLDELNKYLHAKFAEERNNYIAKINPAMPDGGSGITTKDAKDYLAAIPKDKMKDLESVESKVREIVKGTQQELLKMGWETPETIKAWNATFPNYVPLFREDVDYVNHGTGMGQGMASRGAFSMGATGSAKDVTSILDSIFEMREKAIVKGEKARVGRALMALAVANPNPEFWLPIMPDAINDPEQTRRELEALGASGEDIKNLMMEPKVAVVERLKDPVTGQYRNLVVYRVRPNSKFSDNVFPVRINGKDAYIFFNPREERAIRLSKALKNLDVEQLDMLTQQAGKITRFIASMSTQYNPIFGMWNFMRDIQGAGFNLSTTPLKGKQAAVLSDALRIIPDLYKELRAQRRGQEYDSEIAQDYKEFSSLGGPTGYRDQFIKTEESGRIAERMLRELNENNVKATVRAVGGWLSDYNDTLENAIRLAAFRQAKKMGISPESAASIAKELTVNFNRKGAKTPGLSALYAFFNAAVQGNARLLETLKGPAGKKIIAGGIFLGVAQAMILQAFGLGEDDPPEFTKQRNLIIPLGNDQYAMWPMPLGFNFLPTLGRLLTEVTLDPRPELRKPFGKILEAFTNSFNPLGGGGFMQTISPTIIDPFVAVSQNRDAFGRPISREDRATNPTPGYLRSREQASEFSKTLSEILNYMSFGTEFKKGVISPTADDIDYIAGQYLGGVAREAMRAKEFLQSTVTGEPVEPHRVPLVGKIVGDLGAPAAVANKFYSNITTLAEHEQEIKGRIKNRQSPAEYIKEYPESRLFEAANKLENEISKINRNIRELQKMEGREKQVETLKNRKTEMMKRFNERYDAAVK